MNTDETTNADRPIIDTHRPPLWLDGVGVVAVAINEDGTETFWLLAEGGDEGGPVPDVPAHEEVGKLPASVRAKLWPPIFCGRPTSAGRPCRTRVEREGDACSWHGNN